MRDRVVPGQDEPAFRARAQAYFDRMREAYSERDHLRRPSSELFPPSFRDAADNGRTTRRTTRWIRADRLRRR